MDERLSNKCQLLNYLCLELSAGGVIDLGRFKKEAEQRNQVVPDAVVPGRDFTLTQKLDQSGQLFD